MEATQTVLSKYEAYKDSGEAWLGEIPEHWEYKRMKYLFFDYSKKGLPNEELLSVTQDQGVVPRTWVENRMVMPNGALDTFKFIAKGDFAISLRSFEGGLEYCRHNGIISPAYTVLKRRSINIEEFFFKYLFKSKSFISELQTSVVGIREGKNISYQELCYSFLPLPPLSEQTAIATFLDEKTAKIDQAIAQKERLIELLKERKQILIQELVTGKKVWDETTQSWVKPKETVDSGVEWIGEIPKGWEVKRLKYVLKSSSEKVLSRKSTFQYIGMENVESKTGKRVFSDSETEGLANKFNLGDILFGKLRPYLAKVYLADFEGICSTEFIVFKSKAPEYFHQLLLSDSFIQMVDASTYGAKMPRANADWIGNQFIPIASKYEQEKIVKEINKLSDLVTESVDRNQSQITKLKEYKSVLIDSAVTGKIKVSNE